MRRILTSIGLALLAFAGVNAASSAGLAAEWPKDKPVTLVHAFSAGSDYLARLVAAALEKGIGQTVIVENKPGAGGAIGTGYVARQKPDGYTLVTAYPGPAANFTNTMPGLAYKPLQDFEHIIQFSVGDMVLVARKDFPANNFSELITYVKEHPSQVSAGNNGIGSYGHMIETAIMDMAGIDIKLVSYKGSPPIVTDMLSASLDLSVDYLGDAYIKHIEAGTLKPLAVISANRVKILPNVPTLKEAGLDLVAVPWGGIMAPKGTPPAVVKKINDVLTEYLKSDDAIRKFAVAGQVPAPTTPEEFHRIVVDEEALWRNIITKYKIRSE
ncbi:Extra-cytoplasmic solute receptor (plasmid) [Neorhizobium galegae bv. officinalis bv. officinalis str. HAMBI 1141]|uniref:Extra-cytoplasmic solute receptor n=1 Tax=Neorhizobium galegae bv. officinalis bv. officinalis str. HAMBI 1141 TaxID=1028801 RepID=A0A068TH99_NEOGA|nr:MULTISPECIES: tripartite tricarboxylate transporter substrate binding protein [Neorhizobium]MCJ9672523.1 tripartite tricarboxylate transporter substrate binding protein [Neorhizobium sp. SHOUNA12B]MCJ9746975.1 tripartite tricarboxylate transporter substrate binding protein [Neorhizobium sp. SHOUNA12A]MCJ9751917.1 tripartite tricarboxylate transporter substrate binding protein [Neorhizobium sp. BETTINA12A]CDN57416.1 Extra-cytoplasmic solute receptor [Neorhizobium galegae bv. officinalis bv. o